MRGRAVDRIHRQLERAARAGRGDIDRGERADAERQAAQRKSELRGMAQQVPEACGQKRANHPLAFRWQQIAVPQLEHAVGAAGERAVVRGQKQRRAWLRTSDVNKREHVPRGFLVQIAGGLIRETAVRLVHQCARDRDALLLAAGEHVHGAARPVAETDLTEHLAARRRASAPRTPFSSSARRTFSPTSSVGEVEELVHEADVPPAEQRALGLAQAPRRRARRIRWCRRRRDRCRRSD